MTVFKTILKILNKLKGMIDSLYSNTYLQLQCLIQTSGNNDSHFEDSKPDVLIVNKEMKIMR